MPAKPRGNLDTAICTLLDFVDLTHAEVAGFIAVETERIETAIPRLVASGYLIHSPQTGFAFRNTGHWNPDAPENGDTPAGPDSPKRRHDDYLDPSSPFFGRPDEWQIAAGAPA